VQLPNDQLYNPDGSPTSATELMELLNTVFTVLFACELLLNFLSQPMRKFFSNAWSIFDTIVVLMSLVVLGPLDFPISILRALRVVRLFGRLESSKKILAALSVSLVPMCNAFFIMLIVAMICEFPLPMLSLAVRRKLFMPLAQARG
jgi:voltage-gated sodium channel